MEGGGREGCVSNIMVGTSVVARLRHWKSLSSLDKYCWEGDAACFWKSNH